MILKVLAPQIVLLLFSRRAYFLILSQNYIKIIIICIFNEI